MERDPSHGSAHSLRQPQVRPRGAFLPLLPLTPEYLLVQGLHGAGRRELSRKG